MAGVIASVAATVHFILPGTRTQSGRIFHTITAVIMGTAALPYLTMTSASKVR